MKKNLMFRHFGDGIVRKLFKFFTLSFVFLIVSMNLLAADQNKRISVKYEENTLQQVFWDLKSKTDFTYFYSENDLKNQSKISLDVSNVTVAQVLDKVLVNTDLEYKIESDVVIIRKSNEVKKEKAPDKKKIKGNVTDKEGNPLPGVSVVIKGTNTGTATDINGHFELKAEDKDVLVVSFMGMKTQEVKVLGKEKINIKLQQDRIAVDEVIVTGFGAKKKNEYTGAAVTIKKDKIEQVPVPSVEEVLQGNVAGLQSSSFTGQPGAAQEIIIRGVGSISASTSPLYVIDGVPVLSGDISRNTSSANLIASINSNDIENITVLKDASATSIYGARGANGVIVITTKKGKSGDTKYSFDCEYGISDVTADGMEKLNTKQWEELMEETIMNDPNYKQYVTSGQYTYKSLAQVLYSLKNWDSSVNTDWMDLVKRDVARQQQATLSVQGGNNKSNYFTSLSYFDKEGIVKNSDFKRISGLLNHNARLNSKLSLQTKLSIGYSEMHSLASGAAFANPMISAYFAPTVEKAYNKDGSIYVPENGFLMNGQYNPVYLLEHDSKGNKTTKLLGNVQAFYRPIENMKYTIKLGMDYINIEENENGNPVHGDGRDYGGYAYALYTRNFNWVLQNMVDYHWEINPQHKVDFKLMYEAQENKNYDIDAAANMVADESMHYLCSYAKANSASSSFTSWTSASAMFNFNYVYDGKVFFDGTFRREGNSRFSEDNKYGNFWSLGLSYNFSDNLKVRTSYGENGNAGIPSNLYFVAVNYTGSYNSIPVTSVGGVVNKDLTWEKNCPFNIGIDYSLFKNRINGTAEFFTRKTKDLLLTVPVSMTSGRSSIVKNMGAMVNKGIELSVSSMNVNKAVKWTTDMNFTYIHNEVTELNKVDGEYAPLPAGLKRIEVGQDINSFYIPKWAGVNPDNGDPWWFANGKTGKVTSDYDNAKREFQGKSTPSYFGGITNTVRYKDLSLSFQINYMLDYQVFDGWGNYMESDGMSTPRYGGYTTLLDRWQKKGDIAKSPRTLVNGNKKSNRPSTRYMYDGDHLRLRDVTFSYSLPKRYLRNTGMEGLSVYARGVNLYTYCFDKDWKWDPELGSSGMMDFALPMMKSLTVGLRAKF